MRLTQRLGLTKAKDAVKIELDLMAIVPREEWIDFSHRLIHHGRQICIARKPKCPACSMLSFCPRVGVTTMDATDL
jgi:endonuclease-3